MKNTVEWMAANHVAANLLMMVFIIGGLVIGFSIKQEVFPEIDMDMVNISVVYPGAGPEEIEEGIVLKIEEALMGINGIKEMTASAAEGVGRVTVEVMDGEDVDEVLQDIKSEIDRLMTLPEEAEEPVVAKIVRKSEVISVAIYGDVPERSLRETAETIEDELLAFDNITQTALQGVRPYEISIEVPEVTLQSYGLTLSRIAAAIRSASLDLPAGTVKTAGGEVLIRTKEKRYRGFEFSDITILQNPDGTEVKLGDIATINDSFAEVDISGVFDGKPTAMVMVYRVGDQKPDDIANTVIKYVERKNLSLPDSLSITTWNDQSLLFQGRKQLLLRNAALGLTLVFLTLGMFLQVRLSLWVMLGLPISFLGAMMFLPVMDVSINMISLFAFILVLGIVVDDAIVVGESIYEHRMRGKPYLQAAVDGATEVAGPVIFAILSTVTAFLPLLFISGHMGKFIKVIPLIVIPVLVVSLIECLYVLPSHLSRGKKDMDEADRPGLRGAFKRMRARFNIYVERFINGPYSRLLELSVTNKMITIAVAIAVLFVSVGLVGGGIIKFRFFPDVEGDIIIAGIQMPVGTTATDTGKVQQYVLQKGMEAATSFETPEQKVLKNVYGIVGLSLEARPQGGDVTTSSSLATTIMYLVPSEEREVKASDIAVRWRKLVGELPGVEALTIKSNIMDFGANINVQLSHRDFDVLQAATDNLKAEISKYPGVQNIEDSYMQGKRELSLKLKPEARTLGITEADLAVQVRSAFYGAEALRVQRGRNEVKVMVRYPEEDRKTLSTLENMYIFTPSGEGVPLSVAADVTESSGYSVIIRSDRKRVVNVTADVNASVANAEEINRELKGKVVPVLTAEYPGLTADFEGEDKERRDSMGSMLKGYALAMFVIFAMLAIPFRSYSQPLVIMAAIPFGIIGGIAGHLIMGYNLSILSMFGIVALSGVVVNDSLLLIDHINRMRHKGVDLMEAVMASGRRRFRPILLTSLTTFFGLAPMILETSVQAKFLIPMAISLAFGVLFATGITLLLIPTLYMMLERFKQRMGMKAYSVTGFMED